MDMNIYKDKNHTPEERAKDLLSRMTLNEKIGQMHMSGYFDNVLNMIDNGTYPENGVSSTYIVDTVSPKDYNRAQKYQIEHTRLGIPFMAHGESIHGVMFTGATVFPQAIALGSTFDPELIGEIADVIGAEAKAVGICQTYAPNLDISRDPRWGRTEENYGEDPYLTSRLGVAYIKAFQSHILASSPKHYLAHGSPEGGVNSAPSHVGEREVREIMLEPFRAAVQEGHCLSLMPAYSEIDGIPLHGSSYWLNTVLRDELGFDGYTVSDHGALQLLVDEHHVADDAQSAGVRALKSGVNLEAPSSFGYGDALLLALDDGEITEEEIDNAVYRILLTKFRLGLFDSPYINEDQRKVLHTEKSIALARRAARESAVLLKNNGILPLSDSIDKVAVVGPNAAFPQLGDYTTKDATEYSVSILDGLRARLGTDRVSYAKGCYIAAEANIDDAVNVASEADVTVVVLGDNSNCFAGKKWGDEGGGDIVTCGENFDSCTLELPEVQKHLLREIKNTGKTVILVLVTGRPYCIAEECDLADAVFQTWYPGEQGGNALCDLLFGNVSPCGKLPITFPKSLGHLPCYYNYKPTSRGIYQTPDSPSEPTDRQQKNPAALFPFGYGLSYTEFEYSDLKADGRNVSVSVKNVGKYAGKEVIQFYLRQHTCPVTPFVKRLVRFEKIMLQPGESAVVSVQLNDDDFSYIGQSMKKEIGHGGFTLSVGNLCMDILN